MGDSLIVQWTARQAEVVSIAIRPTEPIHEEIARTLRPPISKQAVTKILGGANWPSYAKLSISSSEQTG